ncbi:prepilin-type N-terminal cleavage/methylation domain-containing protein [Psychrobacter faecalis]|uniref:Prepilin-type N-terminal cleavage/methylation domain-containing protein n=1 Tax=Psychrobacter faecalis TaxID=180588 RepID=A0ABT9HFT8_9GAMM|nr:prepilin-type N-terminal cleavage/methylation domain-containing protein [Psychrobacter faecalis]MDP4544626.1 prepilin-type N-terminal cleavage/methylation domain-containing protein [Psychrobacter faecalis]
MIELYKVLSRKQTHFQACNRYGFTLIELIVTVAVLAIILMIATPYILQQLASMEAKRIEGQIKNTLKLAKAESHIRRQNLLVCLSNDGATCHRDSYEKLLLYQTQQLKLCPSTSS